MNTLITASKSSTVPRHNVATIYYTEARLELLRMLRAPSFALPAILFPALFYVLFGVLMAGANRSTFSTYLLATYSIFGVMGPGLFGFGVSVAIEKERGWLNWRRATPSLSGAYFFAKLFMALVFAAIIFSELALLSSTLGGVQLNAIQWLQLFAISAFTALPFCTLGLVIGCCVSAQAAPAIVNFIYLPMAFLSGLWMPITMLPTFFSKIAAIWPSYHAAQIALSIVGQAKDVAITQHLIYLSVFTLILLWIATLLWSRIQSK